MDQHGWRKSHAFACSVLSFSAAFGIEQIFDDPSIGSCKNTLPDPTNLQTYFSELRALSLCGCGDVCEFPVGIPGRLFERVSKDFDCRALLSNSVLDSPSNLLPPPKHVPDQLLDDFTMGGSIPVSPWYWDSTKNTSADSTAELMPIIWSRENIEKLVDSVKSGSLEDETVGNNWAGFGYSYEGSFRIHTLLKRHKKLLNGRQCLVLGSERPWLEALLLGHGVARVTVVEYRKLITNHPNVSAMTPPELWSTPELMGSFDCVASFSSIEHSGLGRYGDVLNPWGDLQTMAKLWCVTRPASVFLIGVPVEQEDSLVWNAHRIYGPRRLAQLFANIAVVEGVYGAGFPQGTPDLMFLGIRKSKDAEVDEVLSRARAPVEEDGNPQCWQGDFSFDFCCREGGNPNCWQGVYTMEFCCSAPKWVVTF
eukprot:TRINITY_DN20442_c0_g1_i1.p1 TRINITY_DN20442_c0_g1~~TRINITY_DN20442_c0_g1_i1.p1  ORF type:complete len:423 (-),score=58.75 TRINITY_DN20442_c0_g1_i1:85-1353(-)